MLYAKPWEHPSAVAAQLSSSLRQLKWIFPPAAQLLLLQLQQGSLVRYRLRLLNVLEGMSWPSCEPLYTTDPSHHEQEISFALSPYVPKKRTTECCSLVVHSWSMVAILTTETSPEHANACLLPRLSCSWTVLHTENLFHLLQLFYFHLWPIYWLFHNTLFNANYLLANRGSWGEGGVDYCVGLWRMNVRREGKVVFHLCDFKYCAHWEIFLKIQELVSVTQYWGRDQQLGLCSTASVHCLYAKESHITHPNWII
jgi:hypothetical protein